MAYVKQTWTNAETEANATTMGHIEDGIYQNSTDISTKHSYSTTEQVVGTYLNETLYRKVVADTLPSTISTWQEVTTINDLDKIVNVYGSVYESTNVYQLFRTDYNSWYFNKQDNKLYIMTVINFILGKDYELIVEYTKTTD